MEINESLKDTRKRNPKLSLKRVGLLLLLLGVVVLIICFPEITKPQMVFSGIPYGICVIFFGGPLSILGIILILLDLFLKKVKKKKE